MKVRFELVSENHATPAPSDDAELVARFQAGEHKVFDELDRRYRQKAFHIVRQKLGNEADALDVIQKAFLKALTHLGQFRGESLFETWLFRIVRTTMADHGREISRQPISQEKPKACRPEAKSLTPLDELVAEENRQLVAGFLHHHATAEMKLIYRLYFEEGLSARQIAATIKGKSLPSIYRLKRRLLHSFKEFLDRRRWSVD